MSRSSQEMDYITQVWTSFGRGMDLLFGRGGSGKKSADSPRCALGTEKLSTKNGHHGHLSGLKGPQGKGPTCACFAFLSMLSLPKFQAPKYLSGPARARGRGSSPRPLPNLLILVVPADSGHCHTSHKRRATLRCWRLFFESN